jgi:transposase
MRITSFLPHLRHIIVQNTIVTDQTITLIAATTRKRAQFPLCRRWSKRVHSHYDRTIRDLPWAGRPVVIRLQVRRFFCGNPRCLRRIFTERVPDLAPVRGRLAHPLRRSWNASASRWEREAVRVWPRPSTCPSVRARCYASCMRYPSRRSPRHVCSASMTSPCGGACRLARFWST